MCWWIPCHRRTAGKNLFDRNNLSLQISDPYKNTTESHLAAWQKWIFIKPTKSLSFQQSKCVSNNGLVTGTETENLMSWRQESNVLEREHFVYLYKMLKLDTRKRVSTLSCSRCCSKQPTVLPLTRNTFHASNAKPSSFCSYNLVFKQSAYFKQLVSSNRAYATL